jgi:uncharacterized repeat protein (TIGR01451 family)
MSLACIHPKLLTIRLAVALLVFLASGEAAFAQRPEVSVKLLAQQVVGSGDKESLVPAEKAKPGDVIQYQAAYVNTGDGAANKVIATVPIPAGLALVDDSARPAAEQASVDGKTFSNVPLTRRVKNDRGAMEERPVPLAEYRALRWSIPQLAPGATITVALRARLLLNGSAQ